jgi:hypothetical protein
MLLAGIFVITATGPDVLAGNLLKQLQGHTCLQEAC